jgi:hypothetical protein
MLVLLKLPGKKPAQTRITPPLWHRSLFMAASTRGIAHIKFCFKIYFWRICNAQVINLNIPQYNSLVSFGHCSAGNFINPIFMQGALPDVSLYAAHLPKRKRGSLVAYDRHRVRA